MPDFNADIFKTDKQATNAVFASLQDTVKFVWINFILNIGTICSAPITRLWTVTTTNGTNTWKTYNWLSFHLHGPLCILAGFQPKLFHAQKMNSFHRAIGNAKESRGVVDPTKETMKRLVALINAGLAKLRT
jgi:hypothetical protein